MKAKTGVLQGLRVIDFGQYVAGPVTAMMLGDYGADVIHIDPPGGPVWDGWKGNAVLMRGKRNIILNLKEEKDLQIARDLIATADIVVENFRPGVMDRLGLGWEACEKLNPALIYCSLPGYSRADEKRRGLPGWEGTICAEGGLYHGVDYYTRKEFYRFDAMPLASMFAAVIACHSIAAALIASAKFALNLSSSSIFFSLRSSGISVQRSCILRMRRKNARYEVRAQRAYILLFRLLEEVRRILCEDGRDRPCSGQIPSRAAEC